MKTLCRYALLAITSLLLSHTAWAGNSAPNNTDALHGLKSSKAVFDVTTQNPKKLSFYLKLISETAKSMQSAGVTPHFVIAFRGPATFLTTSNHDHVKVEDMPIAYKIEKQLNDLSHTPGVKLEQCSVAANALHVDTKSIFPSVKVVGNSWVSLIGYQNKGYALVPVR